MATIELEADETKQIIPEDQADKVYLAEVENNSVRVGHERRYAKDGSTLQAGQQHRLANLRGDQLFAHAFEGASRIRMTRASADVSTNPNRNVAVVEGDVTVSSDIDVSDRTAREMGKVRLEESGGTLINPATEGSLTSTQPRSVNELRNSTPSSEAIDPTNAFSAINVPAGSTVTLRASSTNADPVVIDGSYVLDPGETVSLRVTAFNDIAVSGTSGDEIQAITPGGN